MTTRTIAIHHVTAALRGARRRGLAVDALLTAAGIAPVLLSQPRARVTPDQFARLVKKLWDALDDEFLGFGAVRGRRGTFATMGLLAVHSPDLGTALRRASAFYALFADEEPVRLDVEGDTARLVTRLSMVDDPEHFLTESVLVIAHRFANWLVRTRIPLLLAEFDYPQPAHRAEYDLIFGCPQEFGAPRTAISFAATHLDRPVLQDEASLAGFLHRSPADLLARRDYGSTTGARVHTLLARAVHAGAAGPGGAGLPGLEQVATRLSVSPQTLRRQLREEGTAFSRIKDQVRRDAAVAALVAGRESIEELAVRLGFSEASAFHRAFRRWTGASPGSYRASRSPAPR
ncbi:AraC-type DNA-binding protein [Streptoalloteichus tenebrarius]|uniref:AraC-type DNA-binding protein n=1 Tax=Streptoalloteichus tenebrarius (strain ATCC 17920 / DSM 40477 / JCM 4838 / CBS 697.72 / NBRC 16177 / NCIMB 11028 / NRRL B-12390 / A12253. 1 / ISP 5477) TaxID=1933 RepID=A0ABT1HYZ3_STRSD|nr:AraC family transcriptional regulator [Streptoalloteichus tenebrarius]MCP2260741.1 AraC-type DNA-binding protein [Streptoalloteichus tenebrarius]BFF03448.1 AraC family transcriptional regulator [Streptoalloteichus tenebrarius]